MTTGAIGGSDFIGSKPFKKLRGQAGADEGLTEMMEHAELIADAATAPLWRGESRQDFYASRGPAWEDAPVFEHRGGHAGAPPDWEDDPR